MKEEYCKTCKVKHFNNFACSSCGYRFSSVWPKVSFGSDAYGPDAKYCANCGHEFNKQTELTEKGECFLLDHAR